MQTSGAWMQWGLKAGMSFGVALSMMEYASEEQEKFTQEIVLQ